jgi:co-chaperonin GroES (HSP10)
MKLLGNRLLVSPLPVQEKTEAGIFLPQGDVGDKKLWWRVEQVGTHQPKVTGKFRPHGTSAADFHVGQVVCLNNAFTNTTLEDGRKVVDTQYVEAVME